MTNPIDVQSPRAEHAADVARLINDLTNDWLEWARTSEDELQKFWRSAAQQGLVGLVDGAVAGYGRIYATDAERQRLWLEIWVKIGAEELGIEEALLERLYQKAAARAASSDAGVLLCCHVESRRTHWRQALLNRGFELSRRPVRMLAEFDEPPMNVNWPQGVHVRTFEPTDERSLYDLHMRALKDASDFEAPGYEEWRDFTVGAQSFDPHLCFIAEAGSELVGVALTHVSALDASLGWFDMLGVRADWRHRGIGGALTRHLLREYHRRGFRRVGAGTEVDNPTGAYRVVAAAGFRTVQQFETYAKKLSGPSSGSALFFTRSARRLGRLVARFSR